MAAADGSFVGGHAADVVGVTGRTRSAFRLASACRISLGVLLVDAEDDRFRKPVGLLEEVGQVAGDRSVRARSETVRSKSFVWYSSSGISRP